MTMMTVTMKSSLSLSLSFHRSKVNSQIKIMCTKNTHLINCDPIRHTNFIQLYSELHLIINKCEQVQFQAFLSFAVGGFNHT